MSNNQLKEEIPAFYPIKSKDDLEHVNGFTIDNIDITGKDGSQRMDIYLRHEDTDGTVTYLEIMILPDGKKFITDEYQ